MDKIAVWFSCGAASAVAAKLTIERFPDAEVRVLNTPVPEEHEDNQRFRRDVQDWLGVSIETVVNENPRHRSCDDVWKNNYMSTPSGAKCTQLIKKKSRQQWEAKNPGYTPVLGFTLDEQSRHERFVLTERYIIPVLIDAGVTKADCYRLLQDAGIKLPEIYSLGYPNANCIGCVKATSVTYWNHVRKIHPDIFEQRVIQSDRYGAKLVKCHPKYLDFCSKRDNGLWYNERTGECLHDKTGKLVSPRIHLRDLPADAVGRPMKNMDFECGIFCEER